MKYDIKNGEINYYIELPFMLADTIDAFYQVDEIPICIATYGMPFGIEDKEIFKIKNSSNQFVEFPKSSFYYNELKDFVNKEIKDFIYGKRGQVV